MRIEPLGSRVLVKIVEQEVRTPTGLITPDTAKEKPQMGEVIAVGDDEEIKVKVGDKVLFAKYSGTEVTVDGEDYLILEDSDILARVHDQ